jgi:hydrogenase expression/formation protein HypC
VDEERTVCLGIPGQIVEFVDAEHGIAKADVGGVRRNVNVQLLQEGPDRVDVGDWVLIHVGFAMSKIDEEEAAATFAFLESVGTMYEEELADLADSDIE